MNDTIHAKDGYRVRRIRESIPGYDDPRLVIDGTNPIMLCDYVEYGEYRYNRDNNESFNLCEIFTTQKGNRFVYWRDEEIDTDYITSL